MAALLMIIDYKILLICRVCRGLKIALRSDVITQECSQLLGRNGWITVKSFRTGMGFLKALGSVLAIFLQA